MHVLVHVSSKINPKLKQTFEEIQTTNIFWLYPTKKILHFDFYVLEKKKYSAPYASLQSIQYKISDTKEIDSHYFCPGFLTGKGIKCF